MRHTINLLSFLFTLLIPQINSGQCNQEQTINVCDITVIDFDSDGNPDGIVNIYTETGTTPADGVWRINPLYNAVFNEATGELSTWDLANATQMNTIDEYRFRLFNTTCGTDPAIIADLILGPFSGVALIPGADKDANIEICSTDTIDLYELLSSDDLTPPPHRNGKWEFVANSSGTGFSGTFDLLESIFKANIPYDPGVGLADSEIFELKYVVSGIAPCGPSQETTVKVSVVRQVDPGRTSPTEICESDILLGNWNVDINLRDDTYLSGEDIEGNWTATSDPTGQISNAQDAIVNIREMYDNLVSNNNLRFGCETFSFTYNVPQRSPVCDDRFTNVNFIFYEELRPFSQPTIPQFCLSRQPFTIDLFDQLEFTNTNGIDFIYDDDRYVNWRLVSGPSSLGIREQPNGIDNFDPGINYSLGTCFIGNAEPGIYVFEFGVTPDINCIIDENTVCDPYATDPMDPTFSNNPCENLTALVTIELLPFDYAGENTMDLAFCETVGTIDLRGALTTNGTDTIVTTGVWTDSRGDTVDNSFDIPEITGDSQQFSFTYATTASNGCTDAVDLSFTVFKEPNAGEGSATTLCSDNLSITLFELLSGDPVTTGTWRGPFGYESTDHLGLFDSNDLTIPTLGEGDYVYIVEGNNGCPMGSQATVSISIVEPVTIGNNRSESFCALDGRVNLFTLLDRNTPREGGVFRDLNSPPTGALTPEGVVEFALLPNPMNEINVNYEFTYVIENALPCDESSLTVTVQIIDLPEPNVPPQEFCILDANRLEDIEVDVGRFNWYPTLESEMPIIDNPILTDGDVYHIANLDNEGCESERVTVPIRVLNVGEQFSNGDFCRLDFQDGVTPDNNNQNDTFEMVRNQLPDQVYNIPEAFPNFALKIFNRYGSLVYEGNRNTEEFGGQSNVSISLGDDLPAGTYFYIFEPNFTSNLPIQGSFYLSR